MSFRSAPALMISLVVHMALLGAMAAFKLPEILEPDAVAVETVFTEERMQQEFTQDLDIDTTVSENLAVTAGGMVTSNLGAAASQPIAQQKIEKSEVLEDPKLRVTSIGDITVPGLETLGTDLGEGVVSGEVGARVEGYGAAMHRLTQELTRMMRQQQVMAVWLFDASESLKDDREEIRDNFHKIYEELDIASKQATQRGERFAALETMICAYGATVKPLLPKPTSELDAIKSAIDRIQIDNSGVENTFGAVGSMIDQYGKAAGRSQRKLAIIVMTDETGDDERLVEEVIEKAKRFRSPVYIMGREAIFGYPYTRVRWVDPETGLSHWVQVDRGPETAFPECLQYDGFHGRWDSTSSGFGSYGQVRLVKESGGIYFMLSSDEKDLIGSAVRLQRKFDDIAMKEYEPLLLDRREYARQRDSSPFRKTIWEVIVALNPHLDNELNLRRRHYPMEHERFHEEGQTQFARAIRAMTKLNQAIQRLDKIRPLRAQESEQRWRAAYDLAYAQALSYRVRQFQFLLALDQHDTNYPKPEDPKSNTWDIRHVGKLVEPTEKQIQATKVDTEEIERQRQKAIAMFDYVIQQHPNTPWAQRAQQEKNWGFGIAFHDVFWDPRYNTPEFRARIPKF
ncbi:hypothetical protein Mal4_49290 [Maioricimonas rarisocia]|uniref:VWFA domain-containing protein n=1 Tax=Maioricimonas rarisocia TaxID=2528026 RepID=A0A517ZDL2_9PLAN|nr:VWA domain-containing protein [Maioricimonas rarisocia]QDU40571.1 hypothetical protein Mal4_49290 [Maioricimonas rarisocia]